MGVGHSRTNFGFHPSCRPIERSQILKFCDQLRDNPYLEGDYQDADLSGRPLQVKIVRDWAITYWLDHLVKEVRIVKIEPA